MIVKSDNPVIKEICEWTTAIIIIVIIYVFLSSIYKSIRVDGSSMEPNLHNKDMVIVNKLSYKFNDINVGDMVIFPYKEEPSKIYVKRIIGMPGDKVEIIDNKIVINDKCLDEPYIYETMEKKGDVQFPLVVPENFYFVLGDNRNYSSDSRFSDVGLIDRKDIIGKVQIRVWPFDSVEIL